MKGLTMNKRVLATMDGRGRAKVRVNGRAVPFVTGFDMTADPVSGPMIVLTMKPQAVKFDGHADVTLDAESVNALLDAGFIRASDHEAAIRVVKDETLKAANVELGKRLEQLRAQVESLTAERDELAAEVESLTGSGGE